MEAALMGKTQAAAGIEIRHRGARRPTDAFEPDAMAGLDLFFQKINFIALSQEQIAVTAGEIAVNGFLPRDLFDAVNGCGQTLVQQPRIFFAAQTDEFMIEVVQAADE